MAPQAIFWEAGGALCVYAVTAYTRRARRGAGSLLVQSNTACGGAGTPERPQGAPRGRPLRLVPMRVETDFVR